MTELPKRFYVLAGLIRQAETILWADMQIDYRRPEIVIHSNPRCFYGMRGIAVKVIDPETKIDPRLWLEFERIRKHNGFRDWTEAEIRHLQAIS